MPFMLEAVSKRTSPLTTLSGPVNAFELAVPLELPKTNRPVPSLVRVALPEPSVMLLPIEIPLVALLLVIKNKDEEPARVSV